MNDDPAPVPSLFIADESATLHLARRMAQCLPACSSPFVLYLQGDLGTGKTTLTRGMLHALGEEGPVRSPTYGLIAEYQVTQGPVLHLDLYRMQSPEELESLGLADYLPGSVLWLIEWPERAGGGRLPAADARVWIDVCEAGRTIRIEAVSGAGHAWVRRLIPDAGS